MKEGKNIKKGSWGGLRQRKGEERDIFIISQFQAGGGMFIEIMPFKILEEVKNSIVIFLLFFIFFLGGHVLTCIIYLCARFFSDAFVSECVCVCV